MYNADVSAKKPSIVLVHGMWMTPRSWEGWMERYARRGYNVIAPAWPGFEAEVEAVNRDPASIAGVSVEQILDHYERIIRSLETPPILIGHSFGGAMVELLLDRGLGTSAVAVHPFMVKGVYALPLTTLRCTWQFLINPFSRAPLAYSARKFHYVFTNTLTSAESDAVYRRYYVPAPHRAGFQGVLANFTPHSPMTVHFENNDRAPLLILGGNKDHLLPPAIQKSTARHYAKSRATTEFQVYPGRSHYTLGQPGWEEVADYAVRWSEEHATSVVPVRREVPEAGGVLWPHTT